MTEMSRLLQLVAFIEQTQGRANSLWLHDVINELEQLRDENRKLKAKLREQDENITTDRH